MVPGLVAGLSSKSEELNNDVGTPEEVLGVRKAADDGRWSLASPSIAFLGMCLFFFHSLCLMALEYRRGENDSL